MIFAYAAFTRYGRPFQSSSANHRIGNSTVAGPTTPHPAHPQSSQREQVRSRPRAAARAQDLVADELDKVWAVPISLATTFGIEVSFFSCRY